MRSVDVGLLILLHLTGDYVLQSQPMADHKVSSWWWAFVHAFFYSIPFALWFQHWDRFPDWANFWIIPDRDPMLVICLSHALIDRYRLTGHWNRFWGNAAPGIWNGWSPIKLPPEAIRIWLPIIVDNTLHAWINLYALRCL